MPRKTITISGTLWEAVDTVRIYPDRVAVKFVWNGKPTTIRRYKLHKVERA